MKINLAEIRTAIAQDQLATAGGIGGAEKVLSTLKQLFPSAPVYTTLYNPKKTQKCISPELINKAD